jgi:ankyrin repeat protein
VICEAHPDMNINTFATDGKTALHIAALNKHHHCVNMLVDAGALATPIPHHWSCEVPFLNIHY